MRVPRESGSRAERPLGRAGREGRFGGGAVNGVAARGAPLRARRGSGNRVNKVVPRNRSALRGSVPLIFWEVMKGMQRVNPLGIALMALGVLIVALAGRKIARQSTQNIVKLIGLFVTAGGAMLAILG